MIKGEIEIEELVNGAVAIDFRPGPLDQSTELERQAAKVMGLAIGTAMEFLQKTATSGATMIEGKHITDEIKRAFIKQFGGA